MVAGGSGVVVGASVVVVGLVVVVGASVVVVGAFVVVVGACVVVDIDVSLNRTYIRSIDFLMKKYVHPLNLYV